jgi:hypothetical protein
MFYSFFWIVLAVILVTWPLAVQGQSFCMKHSDFVVIIAKEFQETLAGHGILSDKQVLAVFVSPRGATFTVAFTTSEGITCPIGAGHNWQDISPPRTNMKASYPG